MISRILEGDRIIAPGSIKNEQDSLPGAGIDINPPKDGRCYCCGRHISQLRPFGTAENSLVADFDGSYLVKTWRPTGLYDEEAKQALREADQRFLEEGYESPEEWLADVFGKEKAAQLMHSVEVFATSSARWLCKDCMVLDEYEYLTKLHQRRRVWVEDSPRS